MKIIVQRENLVLWHLICFSVLLAFTACSDNKEEFQEYLTPASGSEAIFEQGFSFAEAASSQSVSFEAGYQWTAELSGEDIGWCSINPAKGLSGKATIMVSVAKNETGIARTAQLNIILLPLLPLLPLPDFQPRSQSFGQTVHIPLPF